MALDQSGTFLDIWTCPTPMLIWDIEVSQAWASNENQELDTSIHIISGLLQEIIDDFWESESKQQQLLLSKIEDFVQFYYLYLYILPRKISYSIQKFRSKIVSKQNEILKLSEWIDGFQDDFQRLSNQISLSIENRYHNKKLS